MAEPLAEPTLETVDAALRGDRAALQALVDALTPVIQARVGRVLLASVGTARGRAVRQELEDMVQDVFVALLERDGRVLRSWDPARGLSLRNFVGLVAQRRALQTLRSGRQSPWTEDPTLGEDLDREVGPARSHEPRVAARELFDRLLDRLRETLSPLGLSLFERLLVEQRPVAEVARELSMTEAAVYAWQGRLRRLVRELAGELTAGGEDGP